MIFSSQPAINTTGNSNPLAACIVSMVTASARRDKDPASALGCLFDPLVGYVDIFE